MSEKFSSCFVGIVDSLRHPLCESTLYTTCFSSSNFKWTTDFVYTLMFTNLLDVKISIKDQMERKGIAKSQGRYLVFKRHHGYFLRNKAISSIRHHGLKPKSCLWSKVIVLFVSFFIISLFRIIISLSFLISSFFMLLFFKESFFKICVIVILILFISRRRRHHHGCLFHTIHALCSSCHLLGSSCLLFGWSSDSLLFCDGKLYVIAVILSLPFDDLDIDIRSMKNWSHCLRIQWINGDEKFEKKSIFKMRYKKCVTGVQLMCKMQNEEYAFSALWSPNSSLPSNDNSDRQSWHNCYFHWGINHTRILPGKGITPSAVK